MFGIRSRRRGIAALRTLVLFGLVGGAMIAAADAQVLQTRKISSTSGNFAGAVQTLDRFGGATSAIGDLDGDGVCDLLVGASLDDDGGLDRGAGWVLFLTPQGTVKSHAKISHLTGLAAAFLEDGDRVGAAATSFADLDGDGVTEVILGAPGDNDGGPDHGGFWVLFMNADGSVKRLQNVSDFHGEFAGMILNGYQFGSGIAAPGDINLDTVPDLVVGSAGDHEGGVAHGSAWVLFMKFDGTVASHRKIITPFGFSAPDAFGFAVATVGDLDGDGTAEVAVGAPGKNGGQGAVAILSIQWDGSLAWTAEISSGIGGLPALQNGDEFGHAVAGIGDYDGDGIPDLAVGAPGADGTGEVWLLFLNSSGQVRDWQRIGPALGGFSGSLDSGDRFGASLAAVPDFDNNGITDLVIGADLDDDGGSDRGAVWFLTMRPAAFPSYTSLGGACPGTAGVPQLALAAGQAPTLGNRFDVVLTNVPAGQPTLGVLGLSSTTWLGAPLPIWLGPLGMPGCSLRVSADLTFPLVSSGGSAIWPILLPNTSAALGQRFYQQAFVLDPGANPAGLTTSNAAAVQIGGSR